MNYFKIGRCTKRVVSGVALGCLFAGIVTPPVEAVPGRLIGYHVVFTVLTFLSITTWLVCRSVKSTAMLLAMTAAAVTSAVLQSHTDIEVILTPIASKITDSLFPCEGGCGVARFDGVVTGLAVLSLLPIFVPLLRFLSRTINFRRMLLVVLDAVG
jgi:hypothetical protein